jgi:hypothetical protein
MANLGHEVGWEMIAKVRLLRISCSNSSFAMLWISDFVQVVVQVADYARGPLRAGEPAD